MIFHWNSLKFVNPANLNKKKVNGYVIAAKGILGQKKKNESCIFQSVGASGDLIDSVLATLVETQSCSWSFFLWAAKWETIIDIADSGFTTF